MGGVYQGLGELSPAKSPGGNEMFGFMNNNQTM